MDKSKSALERNMDAALSIARERGLLAVTLASVGRARGVARGVIHVQTGGLDALLNGLVARCINRQSDPLIVAEGMALGLSAARDPEFQSLSRLQTTWSEAARMLGLTIDETQTGGVREIDGKRRIGGRPR